MRRQLSERKGAEGQIESEGGLLSAPLPQGDRDGTGHSPSLATSCANTPSPLGGKAGSGWRVPQPLPQPPEKCHHHHSLPPPPRICAGLEPPLSFPCSERTHQHTPTPEVGVQPAPTRRVQPAPTRRVCKNFSRASLQVGLEQGGLERKRGTPRSPGENLGSPGVREESAPPQRLEAPLRIHHGEKVPPEGAVCRWGLGGVRDERGWHPKA